MKNNWSVLLIILVLIGGIWFFSADNNNQTLNEEGIGTAVGNIAPSFVVTTIDGEVVDSADLRGQTVVITSSAAWCSTCVAEALQFSAVYQQVDTSEVVFLTIDIDPNVSQDELRTFQSQTVSPWFYANESLAQDLIQDYQLDRFEITYIIDAEGIITYKDNFITNAEVLLEGIHNAK